MTGRQGRLLWSLFLILTILTAVAAGWAFGNSIARTADPAWAHALRFGVALIPLLGQIYVAHRLATLHRSFVAGKVPVGIYILDHSEGFKRGSERCLNVTFRPYRANDADNIHERRIANLPTATLVPHSGPRNLFEVRETSSGVAVALVPREVVDDVAASFPARVRSVTSATAT